MKINKQDGTHHITKSGFQFLLMETSSQVWYFILQYLDTVHSRNLNLPECLNFLFQLSFATLKRLQYRRLNAGLVTVSSAFKGIRFSVSKETNCWEILSDEVST